MALPAAVTDAPYTGVWAADLDLEGDLDLVLGTLDGPPLILRNNGDGTFTALHLFDGIVGLRAFAWGDIDADGAPDAILLDATGTVHVYANQRGGQFQARALPRRSCRAAGCGPPGGDRYLCRRTVRRATVPARRVSDGTATASGTRLG